jgi:hypothetical protein
VKIETAILLPDKAFILRLAALIGRLVQGNIEADVAIDYLKDGVLAQAGGSGDAGTRLPTQLPGGRIERFHQRVFGHLGRRLRGGLFRRGDSLRHGHQSHSNRDERRCTPPRVTDSCRIHLSPSCFLDGGV